MIGRVLARQFGQLARSTVPVLINETNNASSLQRCAAQVAIPVVNSVRGSHHGHGPVQIQHPAPPFKATAVINGDFKEIDLTDFKGQYLVLFFYPLDFTFVCPTEIIAFSDRIDEFKAINTAVVGVSCDSHFSHLAWINMPRKHGGLGELKYPLLADFNKTIARDYNVLLEADGVPLRGLFIIDPQSVVRQITVNDLPVGRSVDEVIRLVKAFQFTDKHGEDLNADVIDVQCVRTSDNQKQKTKFTIPNIKPKTSYPPKFSSSFKETAETKDLNIAQLERLVLLDQLKFYRMQMEELHGRKEEVKKEETSTTSLLHERDCIAV